MLFESYTYKPNPNKTKEDNRHKLEITGVVLFMLIIIAVCYYFSQRIMGIIILGGIAVAVIRLKMNDDKKKGLKRFGSLIDKFSLSEERIVVGDREFKIAALSKLDIDAEDFPGKSIDFFTTSRGIDNFVEFYYDGTDYLFQFVVKSKSDLKIIDVIKKKLK